MAKKDEYIDEAYNELKQLSLDDQKRMEYELRQKAIRDYNSQMKSAEKRGEKRGEKSGEERGKRLGIEIGTRQTLKRIIGKRIEKGDSMEEIAELLEISAEEVRELAEEWKAE